MKSVLVVGMGRFGRHLAMKMQELGNDVMIADCDEAIINELSPQFTDAHIGDCTNESVLRAIGINNFDICFVAIGENFQSSLEVTSLLKELGAKHVVAKASRDIHAKFLLRNGADEVVYPERDMAEKLAIRHNANNIFDYIELTPEFAIYEIPIIKAWSGHSVASINVRNKYGVNILAIKNGTALHPLPGGEYVFRPDDHLVVVGKASHVFKLTERT